MMTLGSSYGPGVVPQKVLTVYLSDCTSGPVATILARPLKSNFREPGWLGPFFRFFPNPLTLRSTRYNCSTRYIGTICLNIIFVLFLRFKFFKYGIAISFYRIIAIIPS